MRTVHGLQSDAIAAAFPRRFVDQLSQTFDHFGEDGTVQKTSLNGVDQSHVTANFIFSIRRTSNMIDF